MFVSAGKIIAIDHVEHDKLTLSGDGVNIPLGVVASALGNTVDVKAGTSNVEVVTARDQESNKVTFKINVEAGGGGGGQSYDIVGENGVSAKKDIVASAWHVGLSAELPDIDALSALIAKTYLSADVFSAYAIDVNKQFTATSAWATDTFQSKGEYLSASNEFLSANALDSLSGKWNEVSAKLPIDALDNLSGKWESTYNTVSTASGGWNAHSALSAEVQKKLDKNEFNTWSATEFVPVKTDVDELKAHSAHYAVESQNAYIEVQSGTNKFELKFVSGALADKPWVTTEIERVLADFGGYVPCEGTGEDKHPAIENPDNKKMYLVPKEDSADPDRYYNWIVTGTDTTGWLCIGDTSMDLTPYLKIADISGVSGQWNTAYNYVTASSGDIASTSATVYEYSASWNAHSALSAAKLDANALDDVSAAWNAHSALSAAKQDALTEAQLSAISSVSSLYNTEVVAGKNVSVDSQTANNTVTYTISADDVLISGNNGISAEFDAENKQWNIGLSAANSYACFNASMTADGNTYSVNEIQQIYNVGNEITFEDGELAITAPGLWHITVNASINNGAANLDDQYYNTTLALTATGKAARTATIQYDNSYDHTETINLDFDQLVTDEEYIRTIQILDAPANAYDVAITNISVHKVAAGITFMEGGTTYVGGKAIKIGDNFEINFQPGSGLQANAEQADVKLGNALGFDSNSAIEVLPGSGLFIDNQKKLSLRLGKGLAFSGDGDVIALETNTDVNDVVETVQELQKELDGKLTTNMNVSDAKDARTSPFAVGGKPIIGATLFTVPLQHAIIESATQISFITSQTLPQDNCDPFILGILEYNFEHYREDPSAPNGVSIASQTTWIADTGPIWRGQGDYYGRDPSTGTGRFTYTLNHVVEQKTAQITGTDGTIYTNEVGPCMRSDRAYYLALFAANGDGYAHILGATGFDSGVNNTDPFISFIQENTYYSDSDHYDKTGEELNYGEMSHSWTGWAASGNDITLKNMSYWHHRQNKQEILRPFVMIRNPRA